MGWRGMGHAWWLIALVLAACELDDAALGRTTQGRVDGRPGRPPARDGDDEIVAPCSGERPQYGCPGMPCAHGWCFTGTCEGAEHDADGQLVDPGVCCADDECDAR